MARWEKNQILNGFPKEEQTLSKRADSGALLQSCGFEQSQSIHLLLSNTHFCYPCPTVGCCQSWQTHGPLGLESHPTGPTHTTPHPSCILPRSWPSRCDAKDLFTWRPSLLALSWPPKCSTSFFFSIIGFSLLLCWERLSASDMLALDWKREEGLKELASHLFTPEVWG